MRMRLLCLLSALLSIVWLIVFSGVSIDAAAASLPSGGHFMTANETLAYIGNNLEVTYFNGTDYTTTTAYYYNAVNMNFTEYSENPVGYLSGSHLWLVYSFSANPWSSPDYLTFNLNPQYSIFDTEYLYTAFALCRTGGVSTSVYSAPSSDWYIGGTDYHFENNNESASGSGVRSYISGDTGTYSQNCAYIPIMHSQNNRFSAYSLNAKFNGFSGSGTWYFWVMCPYVSDEASGASGTFTTAEGGTGGDINVNVDVDLDETNGLLGSILDGISGIGSTISSVFVPDEEDIQDFHDDLADLLTDSFHGYSESADVINQVRDVIVDAQPLSQLTFPAFSVPGTSFHWPPNQEPYVVDLFPDPDLQEKVKLAIDLVATCLFINLIRLKIDEIIHGKVIVEIDEVNDS